MCSLNVWGKPFAEDVEFQGALSLGLSRPGGGGGGPSVVPPGFFCGFCLGGRVWVCCAWLVSLGLLGSNCLQFGLLNSESRARCSGTSGSGQGFRLTLVWMGPGGRAPVLVIQKNEKKDKRLRADRSRQKHLNRWQEDQIPPASRFFAACSRIRIWKEGIYHTLMSRASFLVRARWPGMSQVAVGLAQLTPRARQSARPHLSSGLKDPGSCLQRGGGGRLPLAPVVSTGPGATSGNFK